MQTYTECIPCFIRQAYDALLQTACDDQRVHHTLRRILREAARFPTERTPPEMAQVIHRIVREESGDRDPYAAIKSDSTQRALQWMEEVRSVIVKSENPFRMALSFSIAGNCMDYALPSAGNRCDLDDLIGQTRPDLLEDEAADALQEAARQAHSILILGDNAGETVFDRLLIEQMNGGGILYAVKGSPVINDATLMDAKAAGLDQVAQLIENGSDAPGTLLEDCSDAFRRSFNEADLVIAKGQANYETLSNAPRPLFFLTQVKCPVIARDMGEPDGRWVVRKHRGNGS